MPDGQVVFELRHDTKKELKAGKRRYVDEDGHNLYLQGDEVTELDSADRVKVTIEPA